jgi:alpha-tubulin suppressor-like RCC1 family protein
MENIQTEDEHRDIEKAIDDPVFTHTPTTQIDTAPVEEQTIHQKEPGTETPVQEDQNKVFCYGNAECDQFYIDEDNFESKRPVEVEFYRHSDKIRIIKIACGTQHSMILTEQGKVFTWGNADDGCLGRIVTERSTIPDEVLLPSPVDLISAGESHSICANSKTGKIFLWGTIKSSLKGIFTGANNTFIQNSKGNIWGCGLNNYGQLAIPQIEDDYVVRLPEKIPGLIGSEVKDIVGGEHHSLVLMNDGSVYGAGRNDDAQLGELDDQDCKGLFQKLSHLPSVEKLITANHFNYAKETDQDAYYAWGFGMSFVLANGREESLNEARKVNNEKFFVEGFPSYMSLGHSFVSFTTNPLGSLALLSERVSPPKKRRSPVKLAKDDLKKMNRE